MDIRTSMRVLCLPLLIATGGAAESGSTADRVRSLIEQSSKRLAEVRDYTCRLVAQESIDGTEKPQSHIVLKHQKEPNCVYMKWTGGPHEGREALYCENRYDGELQVNTGGGFTSLFGTMSLEPTGYLAMRGNRHPVTQVGIFTPVRRLQEDLERANRADEHLHFEPVRNETIHGQPSLCSDITWPKASQSAYYAYRSQICIHQELLVPTRIESWDAEGHRLERFEFYDLTLNPDLPENTFDLDNPEYGF